MTKLLLSALFLGNIIVTSYRSVPEQTKPTHCNITSIGEHCNVHGIAISQDWLLSGKLHYGDLLYIEGIGFKIVNDTMAVRKHNTMDVWVQTYEDEKAFDIKFGKQKLKVWLILPLEER